MNEKDYENKFVALARSNYPNRVFIQSFQMPYDEEVPRGVSEMPWYIADVLEIDEHGKFHLWEHKLYKSRGLYVGQVIGQLICYNFIFSTTEVIDGGTQIMRDRILNSAVNQRYNIDHPVLRKINDTSEFKFTSWNIVACGGVGYEFAACHNNIVWHLYSGFEYLADELPKDKNFWHFYITEDGFDLRNLWELNAGFDAQEEQQLSYMPFIFDSFDISTHSNLHQHYEVVGLHKQAWEEFHNEKIIIEDG